MLPRRMYKKATPEELIKKLKDSKDRSEKRQQGLEVEGYEEMDVGNVSEPTILYKGSGREVKYFPPGTINPHKSIVTKSGRSILPCEVAALRLVNDCLPHLPIPKIHEAHRLVDPKTGLDRQSEGVSFQMDYVQGQPLDKMWHLLQEEQKQGIIKQLREILVTMRSIPQASVTKQLSGDPAFSAVGRIGSCTDGGTEGGYAGIGIVRDCRRISVYESDAVCEGEAEFNNFILNLVEGTPAPARKALVNRLRTDHRVVFTHGDVALHNILVDDQCQRITGLIDWEYAGWYPEYWDYIKFFERHLRTPSDWKDYADDIFPQAYHDELVLYQAICRYQMP